MTLKYNAAQATADEWLRRAELAVRKGQDELAREALLRRKTYETSAQVSECCRICCSKIRAGRHSKRRPMVQW